MTTVSQRQATGKALETRDKQAITAIRDEFATPSAAMRLGQLIVEQEVATRSDKTQLSSGARRLRGNFEREGKVLVERISEELTMLNNRWGPLFDRTLPPPRDLLHVYGPDVQGTGGKFFYRLAWTHVDDTRGAGIDANADVRTGKYWASHYTTGPQRRSYAGIGVWLTPIVDSCLLNVRPYVSWAGFDILQHRVFDPQLTERRWATAAAHIGIIIQSWDLTGKAYNVDARHWIPIFSRSELNPASARDYDGIASSGTGLQVQVLGSTKRQYAIWACCHATVIADAGFAVATRASSSVSCSVPFLVVEEIPF